MATIDLSKPPALGGDAKYGEYKPWLLQNFYKNLCSYCLQQYSSLTIDHYVPQSYKPEREHDPTNLLLGCGNCQRKKWDYHPEHIKRKCRRQDSSGHMVLDVRDDDLSQWFEVKKSGELFARDGAHQERAIWNAKLLRLDLYDDERRQLVRKIKSTEELLAALDRGEVEPHPRVEAVVEVLVADLAERQPFLHAYGLPISSLLSTKLDAVRTTQLEGKTS